MAHAASANGWTAPEHPRLRGDLKSRKSQQGSTTLFKVTAPGASGVCLMYDLELSIVRLMNGKRDLDTIVRDGRAQGLPITRELLEKFLRELAAYHLIENADPLPPWQAAAQSAPPPPEPDAPPLFQALGSRKAPADTGEHPAVPELVATEPPDAPEPPVALPSPATATPRPVRAYAGLPQAALTRTTSGPRLSLPALPAEPWARWGAGATAALVLLAGVTALVRPRRLLEPCRLVPARTLRVVAPEAGAILDILASEGRPVHRGDVLLRYDDRELRGELQSVSAQAQALEQKLSVMRRGADPAARAQSEREGAELRRALASVRKSIARRARGPRRAGLPELRSELQRLEARAQAAEDDAPLLAAGADSHRLAHAEAALQSAQARRTELEAELSQMELRAPEDGVVTALASPLALHVVHPGDVLLELAVTRTLAAQVQLPAARARALLGTLARFTLPGSPPFVARGKVVLAEGSASPPAAALVSLKAELDNTDGKLAPGMAGTLELGR